MIIVRLSGGLGNQIFQLAAGLLLADKSNIKKIFLDDSALGSYDVKRINELLSFFDIDKLNVNISFERLYILALRLPKILSFRFSKNIFVSDTNFDMVLENPNHRLLILDGYFQKGLTQNSFNQEIEILKNILIDTRMEYKNDCVVHIRGGDFVKLGWNSVTPSEYYIEAMQYMIKEHNISHFSIVTDDKKYAEEVLPKLDFNYSYIGNSIKEDFYLIGAYNKRILSSSTFSFWASALGNNKDSIVIAPVYWFPNNKRKIFLQNEIITGVKESL